MGLVNKAKEVLHSDKKDNAATDNPRSTNAGPHGSNAMNAADPRVDSDRDNIRSGAGVGHTGTTGAGYGAGHTGTTGAGYGSSTTGTTGAGYGNDPRSTNAGPHSSNLMNSADPRVDSDRDGSRNMGAASNSDYGSSTDGTHGTTGTHGGIGSTGTHGTHGGVGSTGVGSTGVGHSTHGTGVSATPGVVIPTRLLVLTTPIC